MAKTHIATAEFARCDVLLTTDDRFLRRVARNVGTIHVKCENPMQFVARRFTDETA